MCFSIIHEYLGPFSLLILAIVTSCTSRTCIGFIHHIHDIILYCAVKC